MPHHPRLARLLPLLVKTAPHPVRRRLHNQFRPWSQRRPQPRQRLCRIARPACQLRAVQILHRQPSPRVAVSRRNHPVLRVHLWKHHLPHVRPRSSQRPGAAVPPAATPENRYTIRKISSAASCVCATSSVRRSRLRNRLQKKSRRRPTSSIPSAAPSAQCSARPAAVRTPSAPHSPSAEPSSPPASPHQQQLLRQRHSHRPSPQTRRPLIQNPSEPLQLLRIQFFRRKNPLLRSLSSFPPRSPHSARSIRRTSLPLQRCSVPKQTEAQLPSPAYSLSVVAAINRSPRFSSVVRFPACVSVWASSVDPPTSPAHSGFGRQFARSAVHTRRLLRRSVSCPSSPRVPSTDARSAHSRPACSSPGTPQSPHCFLKAPRPRPCSSLRRRGSPLSSANSCVSPSWLLQFSDSLPLLTRHFPSPPFRGYE